jgi:hypothetical protein
MIFFAYVWCRYDETLTIRIWQPNRNTEETRKRNPRDVQEFEAFRQRQSLRSYNKIRTFGI